MTSVEDTSIKQWKSSRKTPEMAEAVKSVYAEIAESMPLQKKKFEEGVLSKMTEDEKKGIEESLNRLGLTFDFTLCHVRYLPDFKPIELDFTVCYVRHGKTEGNTEPRIFQGYCDYWENQLNATGKKQAEEAAKKMESTLTTFKPDLILCSPLGRAIETGAAFFNKHPEIPTRVHYGAREQQFGNWDNVQVQHLPKDDICHLFYLEQNALVKAPQPHVLFDGTIRQEYDSENFVDLLLREAEFLRSVNNEAEVKKAKTKGRLANVLIYGHSMAGAAISTLLGHGKTFNEQGSIGFDGKYIMPNATPTMLPAQTPEVNRK
ncbi:histidine phosphatase domain protein [Gregarina niphandrodes]|uniref:Histidine phosphatase domain protein n=1 Tax=Gregarina niphandrodes TaxID=110365 RepID=A0A023B723_GRENI|nr:histidine phosphatase domain protein [Gregarina niphandrodes]EZG66965.1 histidine phosphatase domain protein [Gregarina niphandrodes]|eukprot:XP_011130402.1 histidine phosphatase domain protein [Gregarina niphandrodes]